MRLYDIAAEIRSLIETCDPETGEIAGDAFDQLTALNLDADAKINAICGIIREQEALAEGASAEAKRLADLARTRDNHVRRLKVYLMQCLDQMGQRKIETAQFKVWLQRSADGLTATLEPDEMPERFQRRVIQTDAAQAIKEWRETGEVPAGFELRPGSEYVRIK